MSASTSAVSGVVEAARGVFSRRLLPSEHLTEKDVQELLKSLGKITVNEVGLAKNAEEERAKAAGLLSGLPFARQKDRRPPVTYYHIYECPDFTVGIFCIPEGRDIPTHDHPGMTVCSKVLYGRVRVESYDEAPDLAGAAGAPPGAIVARKVRDDVVTEGSGPQTLFSESGNIHRFSAVESCAILDVLGPPYDSSQGREIAYYEEDEAEGLGLGEGASVLRKVLPPDDFVVEGRPYTGERVA
eukprot:CAMPEP_0198463954 /NCGR_PEP_ID=MMETSP1456-20131121/2196_1 /TAXON_ID=1461544 ORGANISM="Unidentified sp., Strain RCC1871" /NCGR_SAMPLE_ID=MMETSP1456 /ASSEMBLY_ACC=CAM_ASM_001119 /LENGTH=241 /DNA_ID=CAMNT_0044189541 /DNA_START=221 /DNA_END=946 /DNA_ORIENTATION=-